MQRIALAIWLALAPLAALAQDGVVNPQTNASALTSGTVAAARGGAGTINGALKGNGSGTVSQAACGDLSNATGACLATFTSTTSWTPIDNSGAGLTFTGVNGNYFRFDRVIIAWAQFNYPSTASGANASIGGLPVAAVNSSYVGGGCRINFTNAAVVSQALLTANSTTIDLYAANSLTRATNANMSLAQVDILCIYTVS